MGATKVSVSDTQLDELILKSDFPKLKVAESVRLDPAVEGSDSQKSAIKAQELHKTAPIWTYISIGVLVAQLIILVITIKLIGDFYKDLHQSQKSPNIQASSEPGEEGSVPIAKTQALAKSQSSGLVSNFDEGFLRTTTGGAIYVSSDSASQKALQLSIDSNNKVGKSGNSLKVKYQLSETDGKPASIRFDLKGVFFSQKRQIICRMRLEDPEMRSPEIEWTVIDKQGLIHRSPRSSVYGFWKKYELPMTQLNNSAPSLEVVSIVINLKSEKGPIQGAFFLDDLSVE